MEIEVLGPIAVVGDKGSLEIPRRQGKLALGILAIEANSVVPMTRLVDLIWGDNPPATARAILQSRISELRTAIAEFDLDRTMRLRSASGGYLLAVDPDAIDAHRFRRFVAEAKRSPSTESAVHVLRSALSLWRGPVLGGWLVDGVARNAICEGLDAARLHAYELLYEAELSLGRHVLAAEELLPLANAHPGRERLTELFMVAACRAERTADALLAYDRCRRWLADELGVNPGARLQETHLALLRGEDLAEPPPSVMSPSNASSRAAAHLDPTQPLATPRHYLPRDINDFVGRKLEIAEVTASAINSAVALSIMTISGMGGVGKTALAVRAAHEIIDQYPDGQYFVDLQGFSEGVAPLTPNEALSVLLQAAGVAPEVVPIGINQRSALWRSTLAGQQALVVLDNAVDAAQVRPLLPGTAQNFVIITSRRRLSAIEGEVALSLDVLAPHEAIELLTAIVGKERIDGQEHAVEQVAELCGHLPLALRIAGARLRDRVSWTVPYLVDQLTDQTRRHQVLSTDDRSVMAVLSLSYRLLTDTQQRLVRTLSLHPGADFDVFAAAAMAELTVDEVAIALEALDDHHLLLQQVPGRYRFHDLVRDWAQSLTVEDDGEGKALALQRIADYYLNTVHDWTAPFARGPLRFTPHLRWPTASKPAVDSEAQRWEHLRLEFPNVVAVVRMVFDRAWHSQAWQLVCALQPYLKQIHYGGDSLELFEGALRSSRAAGHWRGESACLTGLASALAERRFHARATTALAEAIAISRANHDTEAELIQLAILGSIMLDELKFADAYQQLSAGVTAAMDVGDDDALASLENNLGVACAEMGRADEAIRHFDRAIRLFVKTGNERPIALAQVNIGVALCRLARWTDAIDVLSDGLDRSRTHEIVRAQGWALATLCLARRVLADFDAALSCGSEALDLAREFQLADVEVEALPAIGETLLAMGDLDNAAHTFSNVQDIAASHSLALGHARAKEGLAHVALARGDVSGAQRHWQEAQRLYPADAADADGPRRHLDATVCGAAVVCLRCAVRSGVERCGEMLETCGSVGKGVPSR